MNASTKIALWCSRTRVGGSVFLRDAFSATGAIVFHRAVISANFECDKGTFKAIQGPALDCEGANIAGFVRLGDGFCSTGEVQFVNAQIGSYFGCAGGKFSNIQPRRINQETAAGMKPSAGESDENICADALKLRGATIKGNLWLGPANTPPYNVKATFEGSLDLRDVHAGVLIDDEESWPVDTVKYKDKELSCYIYLDGFTYNRIGGRSLLDIRLRKRWLDRQPSADLGEEFKPQAFEQLTRVLREMGHTDGARAIAIYKERRRMQRRLSGGWPWGLNPVNWWRFIAYDVIAGWGYRAHRVVIAAIFVWLGCALVYWTADQRGMVTCQEARANGVAVKVDCPSFNAWKYSSDLLLPFNQLDARTSEKAVWKFEAKEANAWAYLLNGLQHFERFFGWIAGIILVALLGRKINKD